MDGDPRVTQHAYRHSVGGIGKSNGLFHRPRPPTPCHPAAILPAAARAWGRPARPAPAAGQRWMPPAGRRLAPQRTDRMGGWGRAACTAGAARGEAAGGGGRGAAASCAARPSRLLSTSKSSKNAILALGRISVSLSVGVSEKVAVEQLERFGTEVMPAFKHAAVAEPASGD